MKRVKGILFRRNKKKKFELRLGSEKLDTYYISDGERSYMHRDGEIVYDACEYWASRGQAQVVLDEYRRINKLVRLAYSYSAGTASFLDKMKPAEPPKHVWVHGDVFTSCVRPEKPMIYMHPNIAKPFVYYFDEGYHPTGTTSLEEYLSMGKFLFNIKDKL